MTSYDDLVERDRAAHVPLPADRLFVLAAYRRMRGTHLAPKQSAASVRDAMACAVAEVALAGHISLRPDVARKYVAACDYLARVTAHAGECVIGAPRSQQFWFFGRASRAGRK